MDRGHLPLANGGHDRHLQAAQIRLEPQPAPQRALFIILVQTNVPQDLSAPKRTSLNPFLLQNEPQLLIVQAARPAVP
jgi:hypothetical protein